VAASGKEVVLNIFNIESKLDNAMQHVQIGPSPFSIGIWQPKMGLSDPV
jgi:hypothetical protein